MTFSVSDNVRAKCLEFDVDISPDARFTRAEDGTFAVEAPAIIRPGDYDIDLVGGFTYLGDHRTFQGSFWRRTNFVGRFCSIAGGVSVGPNEHPTKWLSGHWMFSDDLPWKEAQTFYTRNPDALPRGRANYFEHIVEQRPKVVIGNDVWIGEGAFIRWGVSIGDGAVIGAHAVVTKDVPPYAIVGGSPARILRYRFDPEAIALLLNLQWWSYGVSALDGVDIQDIDFALGQIERNISSGRAEPYSSPILIIGPDVVDLVSAQG